MEIDERIRATNRRNWRVAPYICAFQDEERHLGHLVKADKWHAYDATHLNAQEDGILYLGEFSDLEAAKAAVETSVALPHKTHSGNTPMPAWIF